MLSALYRRAGVDRRHSVVLNASSGLTGDRQSFFSVSRGPEDRGPCTALRMEKYDVAAADLAESAARQTVRAAGVPIDRITHLVTASCSGFAAPGVDLALIDRLGLSLDIERVHVGFMGCHGALNALRVAQGWAASDPDACVLVCAVELCSLHQQYTDDPQQLVANSLFSDGAAAFLVHQSRGESACRLRAQASHIIPETADMMSWRIGNHGFEMSLSPKVPDIVRAVLRPWLADWLAESGLTIEDIRHWAVHPGGPRILAATAEGLELPPGALEHSEAILASHGNMSSPTVLFILERIRSLSAGGPAVMLGFGPGLTIEAALLELS